MTETNETIKKKKETNLSKAHFAVTAFLEALGMDTTHPHTLQTPERVVQCWQEHLLNGYQKEPSTILGQLYPTTQNGIVLVRNIHIHGICPHHLLPFVGRAHIAYLPDQNIVGFSCLSELVESLTRRLTLQETATQEIAQALFTHTRAKGAGCVIEAQHMCMILRDPQHHESQIITSAYLGEFEEQTEWQKMLLGY